MENRMVKLYELATEYRALADQLAEIDLPEQTIQDTLEGAVWPVEEKARAVAQVIANVEADANAYAEHAKQVQAKAKAAKARVEWLKGYLVQNMERAGISKITGAGITITLRHNPESVEVFEAGVIPLEFMRQPEMPPMEPNKAAIKAAIQAGQEIQGARLVRTNRVEIK